jgi:hypothetical protein
MPFEIGKYCRALPSVLSLKVRGQGPRLLSDTVTGILDLSPLYLLEGRETLQSSAQAAPAVGSNFFPAPVDLLVPSGELWYVWHYSLFVTAGAGAAIDMAPLAVMDGSASSVALGNYVTAAATQNARGIMIAPVWALPGTQFGFATRSVTLTPSITANMVLTRLRV